MGTLFPCCLDGFFSPHNVCGDQPGEVNMARGNSAQNGFMSAFHAVMSPAGPSGAQEGVCGQQVVLCLSNWGTQPLKSLMGETW